MAHFPRPHPAALAASCLALGLAAHATTALVAGSQPPVAAFGPLVPGSAWITVKPESVGYASSRLEALRAWLRTGDTAAMTIVVHGQQIFEYGDVSLVSKVASVRKSILALLYGPYVANGTVDLHKTVVELGLQEAQPFLPIEEHATLEHLLTARSGIYLRSGNDELDLQTPKRGSKAPGAYHDYNNWDFNAAGTAFEKLTGQSIYDALERNLAIPIGMQDFTRARQQKVPSPGSVHPEYVMNLSTRDLARIGLLMLRGGRWGDRQVVPAEWCRYLTTLVTPFDRVNPPALSARGQFDRWGYGVMWWVWEDPIVAGGATMGPLQGAYTAWGAGGQYITVLPAADMVVTHKVDIDKPGNASVSPIAYHAILAMALESWCPGDRCE
jgi:CubicO group peptidase (beta-lactamase class C family)